MIFHDGIEYARVSEILKPFSNLEGIDPLVLERKAHIGSNVHKAIEDDIKGALSLPSKDGLGYFNSYLNWKEALNVGFVMSEKRVFWQEWRVTGQIDAIVSYEGSRLKLPYLIDFKTSANEGIESWPMQAHLYMLLLKANAIEVAPCFMFIKLDKEGDFPKVFEYKLSPNIISKCLIAIEEFWKKKEKERK